MKLNSAGHIDKAFRAFERKFNEPSFDFNINLARICVCGLLVWKLLSRDFGFFGTLPENVFYMSPASIYPSTSYVFWTGQTVVTELLTFHWIHWLLPHPGETTLRVIQGAAVASLILLALVGRGPKKIFLVSSYCLLVYLWGYLFLLGQEIDAVAMYFAILVALFSSYRDVGVWRMPELYSSPKTVSGGRSFSMLILVFVFYYFSSGVKKLTDISLEDWFNFDLAGGIQEHSIAAAAGKVGTLTILRYLEGATWIKFVGPPLVYLSHLFIPIMFFKRSLIFKAWAFYTIFHVLSFGVGIAFMGYIAIWFVLFPYREAISKGGRTVARQ